jgi:SH3-like domain-containing protein
VLGACIPTGATALPDDLTAVLRSHARIHAAEGALYARAIAVACEELGIPVLSVRERGVWERAASSTGIAEGELRTQIDAVRKAVGAPWTADHKRAMAAALISA